MELHLLRIFLFQQYWHFTRFVSLFQQSGSVSYGLSDVVILMYLYIGIVALIWSKSYEQRSREGTI